jgi:hypothetical protein
MARRSAYRARSGVGKSVLVDEASWDSLKPRLQPEVIVAHEGTSTDYGPGRTWNASARRSPSSSRTGVCLIRSRWGENVAFPLRERRHFRKSRFTRIVDGPLDMVESKRCATSCPRTYPHGMKRLGGNRPRPGRPAGMRSSMTNPQPWSDPLRAQTARGPDQAPENPVAPDQRSW